MMRHECDSTVFRRWSTGLEKGALPEFSIRDFVSVFVSGQVPALRDSTCNSMRS
jgi:hypothetical protein